MNLESNNALVFENRALFRAWLERNGETSDGVWLVFAKTKTFTTLSAQEALLEALCFGWIDGQMQSLDAQKYIKYFSRRQATSNWSEKNKQLAQALVAQGLMARQGLQAIAQAKQCGKWEHSKRFSANEQDILTFTETVKPYAAAYANLMAMAPSVRRTYTLFYLDAKSEATRQKRLEKIVARLELGLGPM